MITTSATMPPRILFSFLLLTGAAALDADESKSDLAPVISRPGELVFEDDFDKTEIRPEWKPLHGTRWTIVGGKLQGEPSTKEYRQAQIAKGNRRHSGGHSQQPLAGPGG